MLYRSWLPLALLVAFAAATSAQGQIPWRTDLNEAVALAQQSGRPILVHFYTESCPPCKMLEHRAFRDPTFIRTVSESTIPVKINADEQRNIADHFAVNRWPTDVYLFPDGSELHRTVCPQDPAAYSQLIERVSTRCRDWHTERLQFTNLGNGHQQRNTAEDSPSSTSNDANGTSQRGRSSMPTSLASHQRSFTSHATQSFASSVADAESPRPRINRYRNEAPHFQQNSADSPSPRSVEIISPFVQPPNASIESHTIAPLKTSSETTSNRSLLVASRSDQPMVNRPSNAREILDDPRDLALDGYCPIALEAQRWERGNPDIAVRHRGRIYYLSSEQARAAFLENPDRFSPMLSGYDVVRFLENGQIVSGKREFGCWFSGRVFLFESEETRRVFDANVDRYLQQLQALQRQSDASGAN